MEYPEDATTFAIDDQYMIGEGQGGFAGCGGVPTPVWGSSPPPQC